MKLLAGLVIVALIAYLLVRKYIARQANGVASKNAVFSEVSNLFEKFTIYPAASAGSIRLDGQFKNHWFQLQTIVDTLPVRKLPSLWLLVTLPVSVKVDAKLDMMMRPAGPTTFSNFDFLPHTIYTNSDFPSLAVLRSDYQSGYANIDIVKRHLNFFENPRAKELLITPQGLRLVVQLAEAERAHYGVFREARFNYGSVNLNLIEVMMNSLLALKVDLENDGTK